MNIGMLWFDNDKNSDVTSKVNRAADYYQDKYGKEPTVCFVHPSMMGENGRKQNNKKLRAGKVDVLTSQEMLPNHFWIGVNGKK